MWIVVEKTILMTKRLLRQNWQKNKLGRNKKKCSAHVEAKKPAAILPVVAMFQCAAVKKHWGPSKTQAWIKIDFFVKVVIHAQKMIQSIFAKALVAMMSSGFNPVLSEHDTEVE